MRTLNSATNLLPKLVQDKTGPHHIAQIDQNTCVHSSPVVHIVTTVLHTLCLCLAACAVYLSYSGCHRAPDNKYSHL